MDHGPSELIERRQPCQVALRIVLEVFRPPLLAGVAPDRIDTVAHVKTSPASTNQSSTERFSVHVAIPPYLHHVQITT